MGWAILTAICVSSYVGVGYYRQGVGTVPVGTFPEPSVPLVFSLWSKMISHHERFPNRQKNGFWVLMILSFSTQ